MNLKHAEQAVPRRYTAEQLGRLMEISSSVKCECPNQVARIVTSMGHFEEYERGCANANEADRAVHQKLYEITVQARVLMEEALALVILHDKLEL